MIYCVGLTGNIASGKSTVANLFSELGIKIINADQVSRELTAPNTIAYKEIISHFGTKIILENGELNRRQLREHIFTNPDERVWLERLLHPLIRQELEQQIQLCTTPYCVVEIPLLIDKKNYPYLNRILLVTSSLDIQIKRVMMRDHCTKEQALAIISVQPNIRERLKCADDVLVNDSNQDELKEAVSELHFKYLNKSNP
ncbi:dephospho-CoA kinase [uncultured Legionella sp.]|uniref:dephospho-CoA kinase n=1 Tax=uncultured Legionella sp. TaxID=210934 RepID=UPI00262D6FA8|nr:dephospho-CoA kinase [uncultured Legionella sp.]